MQRVGHLGVRSAVVTVLSALLLVCTGSFAQAVQAPHAARSTPLSAGATAAQSAALHPRTEPDSAAKPGTLVVARPHRASQAHRLDGSGPALVPDRAESPRPSYGVVRRSTAADRLHPTTQVTAKGRAPPV